MKILALDTATEACSVALLNQDRTVHNFEVCPQQHSQRLLPMIDELLSTQGLQVSAMDYLCFGQGPGSFTGVRIATGMIQGLALGTQLPVVGVSTLATMAQQAIDEHDAQHIAVAIDARMGEVYFAQFRNQQGIAVAIGDEQVLAPEEAAKLILDDTDYFAGTGWQAYEALKESSQLQSECSILYPNALHMLPLARTAIAANQAVAVEQIKPVYLRDKVTWKKLPGRE